MVTHDTLPAMPVRVDATGRGYVWQASALHPVRLRSGARVVAASGVYDMRQEAVPVVCDWPCGVRTVAADTAPGTVDGRGLVRGGVRA